MRVFAVATAIVAVLLAVGCVHYPLPDSDQASVDALSTVMKAESDNGFWGVVYIAKGGRVLLKKGYGLADRKSGTKFTAQTIVDSGSLSKQVTAAAALSLVAEGRLSLADPLSKYFDNVPADKAEITIRQLLSHTGGIEEWVFPDDFTPIPQDEWLKRVFAAKLVSEPGSKYHYSNDGVTLVAIIVEKVSGTPFRDYVRAKFFDPLGMKQTGWSDDPVFDETGVLVATGYRNGKDDGAPNEWPGPSWALLGNGGISWTVDDMRKWHDAVHGDLLPGKIRDQLFEPVVEDPEHFLYPSETAPMYYGLGWRIGTSLCGDKRISHTGTGVSHNVDYRYYADRDILIYVASNRIDVDFRDEGVYYSRRAAEALSKVFMASCAVEALRN